jgi:3-oxoadipate enol-lactonase / 4-carboxymuconolactone decarboxylase
MTIPRLIGTDFGGPPNAPLLLLGPSVGTTATALWGAAAERLAKHAHVVGWDLPGHGKSPTSAFRMPDLAAGVVALADDIAPGTAFHYAGNSIGGAVGLQLLLDAPQCLMSAALVCTGAAIGRPEDWPDRAALVRASGTDALAERLSQRWFAPGFFDRHPDVAGVMLDNLRNADDESYAQACEALGEFDVTKRLSEITTPVLAIAGAEDVATPPENLAVIASGVKDGRLLVLDGVGHLAPAEAPERIAELIRELL